MMIEDALAAYDRREQQLGPELMRELERQILLRIIDNRWREHLYEMDYLREGIHLRGFAQIDPLVAYKNEGFSMFEELMNAVWAEFARTIFNVEIKVEAPEGAQRVFGAAGDRTRDVNYSGGGPEQPSAIAEAAQGAAAGTATAAAPAAAATATAGNGSPDADPTRDPTTGTVHKDDRDKIGRNDPCWCGSGKKYKKCHGA
jgi:preprotein translocase subunit SecA